MLNTEDVQKEGTFKNLALLWIQGMSKYTVPSEANVCSFLIYNMLTFHKPFTLKQFCWS